MADENIVRALTAGELREARWVYGASIDFGRTRIHRGKWQSWQPDNTAMAPNGYIYFPPPIYRPDYSINPDAMSFLIHELGHVWQVQSGVWLKMTRLFQGGVYDYGQLSTERELRSYTVEQQASIIADWYRVRHRLRPQHGNATAANYEAVIRRAIPAAPAR